ncbi:MAG: 2-C-methyl-D-erythritol 4-phosphate cytidylyltransferase, partial [Solirubrobacterales bacterium]
MKPAKFFAVIPDAGIGRRVGGDRPKQYLEIAGRTVLEWTVSRIAAFERVRRVVIPVAADDDYFT